VQSAPLPVRIIAKGLASDRVVIDTVVSKYADHVPLYRQSAILERGNRHRTVPRDSGCGGSCEWVNF
jgi:transposase